MHKLPKLSYSYDALESFVDEKTMKIHHTKHHQGYVNKLNDTLQGTKFEDWSLEQLLKGLKDLPSKIRTSVRNNGGGHSNHVLFFEGMSPSGKDEPEGDLLEALKDSFGSFKEFKNEFEDVAGSHFGSGWAWLVKSGDGLEIYSTSGHDSPISDGFKPLLNLDVWEHAYYLKYQNKRGDYVKNFWSVVDWGEIEKRYEE
ncbi:MAG: superoxide dismutase [Patescibacteria group bacterium]